MNDKEHEYYDRKVEKKNPRRMDSEGRFQGERIPDTGLES